MTASVTDQVLAWSTLAAVIVALSASVGPAVWRWWKRPRLELEVGRREPLAAPLRQTQEPYAYIGVSIRLRVSNKAGRRQAENVRAQLQAVLEFDRGSNAWLDPVLDITPLYWASRAAEADQSAAHTTVIPSGLSDYVEFAYWSSETNTLSVRQGPRGSDPAVERFGGPDVRFRLAVTADGVSPVVRWAKVTVVGSLDQVAFCDAPAAGTVRHMSMVGFMFPEEEGSPWRDPMSPTYDPMRAMYDGSTETRGSAQRRPDLRRKIADLLGWGR